MNRIQKLKKNPKTKWVIIAMIIVMIWASTGEVEKKEFKLPEECTGSSQTECVAMGCVWSPDRLVDFCTPCIPIGEKISKADIYDAYPAKFPDEICCSGAYLLLEDANAFIPFNQPGLICKSKDDPDAVIPAEKPVCNKIETEIGDVIKDVFPNRTCKQRYYILVLGGGFAALMLLMMI